jgi:hypothetical protein
MDSQRRAEIEAIYAEVKEEAEAWQRGLFYAAGDGWNPDAAALEAALCELLAEVDRLNSERTSMIEHHAFRWLPEQHHPAEVGQSNRRQHTNADHDSGTAKLNRDEGILPPGQS